ncbi:MAG: insulinase family protein [Myxococcales bacterium]|nr:insulinase family protein [Myxococcales bacterium]
MPTRLGCQVLFAASIMVASTTATGTRLALADVALPSAEVQTAELPNGLQVVVVTRTSAPLVAVQIWYKVGSKDESKTRRGTAHMFEHLMFMGSTGVRPDDHARMLNRVGGYVGATTTEDATYFQNVVPKAYLATVLQLEADRMRGLVFQPEALAAARGAMQRELRQLLAAPVTKGLLTFLATAFRSHPYAWTADGSAADVDAIDEATLRAFYDAYYQPNNALLVVVGDTTLAEVVAGATKFFGPIAAAGQPPRPADAALEPAQTAPRTVTAEASAVGMIMVGFPIPRGGHADIAPLRVISALLGDGPASRLARRMSRADGATKGPLAFQTSSPILVREHPSQLIAFAAFLDPASREAVQAAILDEVARLASRDVDEKDLALVKARLIDGAMRQLERSSDLAQLLGNSWIVNGDPAAFATQLTQMARVSAADIRRVAATHLDAQRATIAYVPPSTSPAAAVTPLSTPKKATP